MKLKRLGELHSESHDLLSSPSIANLFKFTACGMHGKTVNTLTDPSRISHV